MTRPIGERFRCDGVLLEVVEDTHEPPPCAGCYFGEKKDNGLYPLHNNPVTGNCSSSGRTDHREVIFKRIKDGGEE